MEDTLIHVSQNYMDFMSINFLLFITINVIRTLDLIDCAIKFSFVFCKRSKLFSNNPSTISFCVHFNYRTVWLFVSGIFPLHDVAIVVVAAVVVVVVFVIVYFICKKGAVMVLVGRLVVAKFSFVAKYFIVIFSAFCVYRCVCVCAVCLGQYYLYKEKQAPKKTNGPGTTTKLKPLTITL